MDYLLGVLMLTAAFVAMPTALASFTIIAQGKRLSIERYQPDDTQFVNMMNATGHHNEWASNNGFELMGYYRVLMAQSVVSVAVWSRSDRPTVLCLYIVRVGHAQNISTDIVTDFADQIALTSNDSKSAQFSPWRPGKYHQTFSPVTLDELWTKHIEAENYLMEAGGARLIQKEFQFEKEFIDSCRRQNAYIRSIPLWYLKGAYWYFIRRNVWHNKSIKQQHEKKMVKLPNELPTVDTLKVQIG